MAVRLPYDISRCPNSNCEQAQNCKRFLAPRRTQNEGSQTFVIFPLWPECEALIPVNEELSND